MNPYDYLKPEEIAAIGILEKGGFELFTEAKIEDVRELKTGSRRRTFRNSGRYQLIIAFKKLSEREGRTNPGRGGAAADTDAGPPDEKPVDEMTRQELISAVAEIEGAPNPSRTKTDDLKQILMDFRAGVFDPSKYAE